MSFFRALYHFLAVSFVVFGFKHVSHAETLDEAVRAALQQHPSVESARASIAAADESKREEVSGYFPELSVSGTGGRLFGDNSTSRGLSVTRGDGYSDLWEGTLTARQMIFDGFETKNRVRSAAARLQSADMELVDVREALALRTVQAYIDVMRAHEGLALLKDQEQKVLGYLERIKASVEQGASDESEYQQARDVSVILDGFISDYEGQARAAEAQYFEVTGHFPEGDMSLPSLDSSFLPEDVEDAVSYAEANHPSLISAVFNSESAGHDIDSEKAQLYPDVNGELSYLKSDKADILGGETVDARAVLRLNWNFETGGAQMARIKRSKYEHQESLSRINELRRQIDAAVRISYSDLWTAQEQLMHQNKRMELNAILFETYKTQFEGARINLLQLMQGDNQYFNTRLEGLIAEYRLLFAQYTTLASMGRLQSALNLTTAESAIDSYFDPEPIADDQN